MFNRIKFFITLLGLIFSSPNALCNSEPLPPKGWRLPNKSDYIAENLKFMKGKIPSYVIADFNGDGIKDFALILIRNRSKKFGLFVLLGQKDGSYRLIKLDESKKEFSHLNIGISLMTPGKYETACAKGYGDGCKPDEPEVLELKNPGIDYFIFESANSVFFWDKASNTFKRIWMSD